MVETVNPIDPESIETGFQSFENTAIDDTLAIAYNHKGDRLAIASADHRLRVYMEAFDRQWTLYDQWRGHDAEIIDASSLEHRF